jgi:hypothetical protein
MKNISLALVLVLSLALLAGTAFAAFDAQVNGSGHYLLSDGSLRTFTFNAQQDSDGNVDGVANIVRKDGIHIMIDVDCLNVSGNTAWISGWDSNQPFDDVVEDYYWNIQVVDNGEGNSTMDEVSGAYGTLAEDPEFFTCNDAFDLGTNPIVAGNVQVK